MSAKPKPYTVLLRDNITNLREQMILQFNDGSMYYLQNIVHDEYVWSKLFDFTMVSAEWQAWFKKGGMAAVSQVTPNTLDVFLPSVGMTGQGFVKVTMIPIMLDTYLAELRRDQERRNERQRVTRPKVSVLPGRRRILI